MAKRINSISTFNRRNKLPGINIAGVNIAGVNIAGAIIAGAITAFIAATLGALLLQAPSLAITEILFDPYYLHVTKFSFYQATLSTLLSIGLAIPVASALSRRDFWGKALLLRLFSMTLVLPVLVAVFGLIAIYGNSGLLKQFFTFLELQSSFNIYGLNGIIIAHLFFNLPFASRLLLQSLQSLPNEQHKLAAHLGLSPWYKFKLLEWPHLRQQIPHIAGLIFMLCFTSFTTVMVLGGGPKSTTIELAIYQAIKFDFDLQTGALLAIWQIILCTLLSLSIQKLAKPVVIEKGSGSGERNPLFQDSFKLKCWDLSCIFFTLLLVLPPLLMILLSGINSQLIEVFSDGQFWHATGNSFAIAALASSLALITGFLLLLSSRHWRISGLNFRADKLELIGSIILVTPGLVLSTGLFLLLRNISDVFSLAFWVVTFINMLMALPYVIKTLSQPMLHCALQYNQLCTSLGVSGISRLRLIEWQVLRKPISYAFAISFLLSMGDLSAIALFGSQEFRTLPLYLYQLLGSYQMQAAAIVALFLLLISLFVFVFIEKIFKAKGE